MTLVIRPIDEQRVREIIREEIDAAIERFDRGDALRIEGIKQAVSDWAAGREPRSETSAQDRPPHA